ncbi:hybrid sensor histidine kinase/response regulator [Comamonas serinivorans]|uniref:Virulence sensor protein BvgS n=1 Tax=Comamonas serinivorans TaxID=1082851 RepID=A0A1Y0EST0_9BURK|nr:ATP-binding protein [Comamonas serinivorans]ARU06578.1 hybrid sensor histidine kinase/response regulator [Comamonas serinivorans]
MTAAPQKIFPIRREYNAWVADETLEDYALRYTPRSARRWSEWQVANTAFGGVSFLALEAIGAAIALSYGFATAAWAIGVMGLIIFLTALPISVSAARLGLDMDLLTRGAGFGYLGSTLTSLIYATFTFIFFAVEAAIMALAMQLALGWPLVACYIVASLLIIPLVLYGITFISRLQAWTQPVWIVLLLTPFLWLAVQQPHLLSDMTGLKGLVTDSADLDLLAFGAAATMVSALVVQVGEQVDYLRFMPERTPANRWRWWACVLIGGPGWIVMGAARMLGGAFLAYAAMQYGATVEQAMDPTHMYLSAFWQITRDHGLAVWVTLVFVVIAQVKINVTNAYAGSLAWSNVFSRLTRSHPGRVVWLVFNVMIATLIMTLGVFAALEKVLGIYSNVAVAWVGTLVADLVINKRLGFSPRGIEFRRAYLYDLNPVGLVAMGVSAVVAGVAYTGAFGAWPAAYAPFIALGLALLLTPLLAWLTRGRWYLARPQDGLPEALQTCIVCQNRFERPDTAQCPAYGGVICSLCCSLDSRCHDRCKPPEARAGVQLRRAIWAVLPARLSQGINVRVMAYLGTLAMLAVPAALAFWMVYAPQSQGLHGPALRWALLQAFALLLLLCAVYAWWVVLVSDSRRMAREETERQTQLLLKEVEAHRQTDRALQAAKEHAEAANQAKSRYVAGMAHELRTPLTSILGYAQLLYKRDDLAASAREHMATVLQSGEHMQSLIDELLDLARIEAGRLRLDPAPLRFPDFLQALARMVGPQAEAKGLRFSLQVRGRLPVWVRADAKRLRQILINLLGNAIRFTDEGEVALHVDCHSNVVRFDIVDTGIGIAPQDQERIFMPFERGSAGRRASSAGTGLGLSITRMLTVLMGGDIGLHSRPGQGSTFTVRLYLSEVQAPPEDLAPRSPDLRVVVGYAGPRRTLLVVDDQPIHRQLQAGLLIPLGFQVREAASGRECLEIVQEVLPDAVLLDLSMDDLSGWETARLLRARYSARELPIVIVSADLFENQPDRLQAADCQAFVAKPVRESELLDTLARLLDLTWDEQDYQPLAIVGGDKVPAGPSAPLAGVPALPPALRDTLLQLAGFGNALACRQALAQALAQDPALAPVLQPLDELARRFDLAGLQARLRAAADNDDVDELDGEPDDERDGERNGQTDAVEDPNA